jgi:hypothetical protein
MKYLFLMLFTYGQASQLTIVLKKEPEGLFYSRSAPNTPLKNPKLRDRMKHLSVDTTNIEHELRLDLIMKKIRLGVKKYSQSARIAPVANTVIENNNDPITPPFLSSDDDN